MATGQSRPTSRLTREERRVQLMHAARSVFVGLGFHAASMDDIAEAAGVSKPVLYQHFPSKQALYLTLLEASADDMVRRVREAISSSDDNNTRVHRAVAAYVTFVSDENQNFRLIFESDLRDQPDAAAVVDRAIEACIESITETITADTGTDAASARLLAAGLVGLSQVGARYWLAQTESIDQHHAAELLAALAWRGISHFPMQNP